MSRTILLIEYQPRSVDHIRGLLEGHDFRLEVARDAAAGVEAFRNLAPDLTLIASMLPKRSGFDVCRELKDAARGNPAPVIVITSRKRKRKAKGENLEACGCDDHVQRPVRKKTLLAKIRALLDVEIAEPDSDAPKPADAPELTEGSFDYAAIVDDAEGESTPSLELTEAEINEYLEDALPEEIPHGDVATTTDRPDFQTAAPTPDTRFGPFGGSPGVESPGEPAPLAEGSRARRLVTGDLESLGLAEITQTLSLNLKTACVILRHDGREGKIWFEDGKVRHAVCGGMEGEPAFFEMVRWKTGEFAIEHEVTCAARTLDQDAMYLVMEGTRLADESMNGIVESLAAVPLAIPVEPRPVARPESRAASPPEPTRQPAGASRGGAATFVRERGPIYRMLGLAVLAAAAVAAGYYLTRGATDEPARERRAAEAALVGPEYVFDESRTKEVPEAEAGSEGSESASETEPPVASGESSPGAPSSTKQARSSTRGGDTGSVDLASEAPLLLARATEGSLPAAAAAAATTPATVRPPEAVEIELPAPSRSTGPTYLDLAVKSHLDAGTLTLLVDGVEVYSRELSSDGKQARRFFRRVEAFDARIELTPGPHEVVARIALEDGADGFEDRLVVDLEPGEPRRLQLVAGKTRGRPIALKSK